MNYIYTVTNVGPTNENINSLFTRLNVNFKDLTYALGITDLLPGDNVAKTEIVSIGICQKVTKFSVSSKVDATSPFIVICEYTG